MKKEIKEKVKKETKQKEKVPKKECPLVEKSSLKDSAVVTKEILSGAIKEMVDLLKKMNNNHFLLSDEVKSIKKMISYDSEMTIKEQFADVHACISSVNKMREEFEDEQKREYQRINARLDCSENVANDVEKIQHVIAKYQVNAEKFKIENSIARKDLSKSAFILLSFIGLNFGITIFLLINFFVLFDF